MKAKRFLTVALTALMAVTAVFTLASCDEASDKAEKTEKKERKPITIEVFRENVENEGFEVTLREKEMNGVNMQVAFAYKKGFEIEFAVIDKENEKCGDLLDSIDGWIKEQSEGSDVDVISKTTDENYNCLEMTDDYLNHYYFGARIENTAIIAECKDDDMGYVQGIMDKLGYR